MYDIDVAKTGKRLRELRQAKGLTRQNACDILACTKESMRRWEVGLNLPSINYLLDMTEVYGVEQVEDLLIARKRG